MEQLIELLHLFDALNHYEMLSQSVANGFNPGAKLLHAVDCRLSSAEKAIEQHILVGFIILC
jgi:hypothetical protein